ncbi:MAG: polyprenyl synthetase family protein [Acidobacteria bacterium]|nr:polyprenyl synthetase family protein [Acidobacteriota bacterium]
MAWQEIFDLIRPELALVEEQIRAESVSSASVVTAIGQYLQVSGGKRVRPALVLLSAKLFGAASRSAINLGTVTEIIHTATLVHDDVIDEADRRRGRPSTNSRWGNHTSVLAGDWLYMQAFKIAVQERNFRILDILIELTQLMVEGELIQMGMIGRVDLKVEEHLDLIYRKTACLFGACTRLGAVLGGQDDHTQNLLGEYGRNLGMAFQLVDDLLDFTASEEILGKPVGSDLREGKVTLALIHALKRCTAEEKAKIEKVIEEGAFRSVSWNEVLDLLHRYDTLRMVKEQAEKYSLAALECLETLPDSPYKRALIALPDFVINRES